MQYTSIYLACRSMGLDTAGGCAKSPYFTYTLPFKSQMKMKT